MPRDHHIRSAGESGGAALLLGRRGLAAARRQRRALELTEHRPWPLPDGPWVMGQTWERLLFAHWPLDPARLAPSVPAPLALDTFDGAAWLAVTPFAVTGLHPRGLPPLAPWAFFLEVNVRTYVTLDGRPGILFLSLDASRRLTAAAARVAYRLPYHLADAAATAVDGAVDYRSARRWRGPPARLQVRYRAAGVPAAAPPGSLEAFLVERYRLYATDERGRLLATDIHHAPWRIAPAEADIADVSLVPAEVGPLGPPRLAHVAEPQDTLAWAPQLVA